MCMKLTLHFGIENFYKNWVYSLVILHLPFIYETKISQNGHQEDFHDIIFTKSTRLLLNVPTIHWSCTILFSQSISHYAFLSISASERCWDLIIPCEYNSMYGINILELWHVSYVCGSFSPLAISRINQRIILLISPVEWVASNFLAR